jgi:hypothetical protein
MRNPRRVTSFLAAAVVAAAFADVASAANYVGQSYGASVPLAPPTPIESVLGKAKDLVGQSVLVSGKVSAVCQMKGCWLTLVGGEGNASTVHMTFKDYGFFVPKDLPGHSVVAQGTFRTETVSVAEQRHLAKDAGKSQAEIDAITQDKVETSFEAAGVRVVEGPK